MNYTEQVWDFACAGDHLLGIVTAPALPVPAPLGVLIVVGGPQYRAGSHRQFVSLARGLASAGHPVMRFDYRGMGDSTGKPHNFEGVQEDIEAAITAFLAGPAAPRQVVLWGLCDGASAALMYCEQSHDPRVAGLALLNPWVRSAHSLARTKVKHYYGQRLLQRGFWSKLVRGKVPLSALLGLAGDVRTASQATSTFVPKGAFQQQMAAGWLAFSGPILLLLSEQDATAREFTEYTAADPAWQLALQRRQPTRVVVPGADHTCSTPGAKLAVETAMRTWLAGMPRQAAGLRGRERA